MTRARAPLQRGVWHRLRPALLAPPILACVVFIVLITLAAIFAPLLPLPDPSEQSVLFRLTPPSTVHLLGTDRLGRDILSRILWGARVSLAVGVVAVAMAAFVGTLMGLIGGYYKNWVAQVVDRFSDMLLAFPPLILAMVVVTVLGQNLLNVMIAIAIGSVPRFARLARATILTIRERDYVEASRAVGAPTSRIMLRHIMLNAVDPLIVACTLFIPGAIITEALLSFLGLGVQPPAPTWGNMINDGQLVMQTAPWLIIFPGAAIVLTVLAFNLLGDAVRDALDPSIDVSAAPTVNAPAREEAGPAGEPAVAGA